MIAIWGVLVIPDVMICSGLEQAYNTLLYAEDTVFSLTAEVAACFASMQKQRCLLNMLLLFSKCRNWPIQMRDMEKEER